MKVDKEKVEEAMGYVNEVRHSLEPGRTRGLLAAAYCVLEMIYKEATDSDPGVECECECEGCRAKDAEEVSPDSSSEDSGPCGPLEIKPVQFTFHNDQPSDYEIRVNAWNIVNDCLWETGNDEFSATLDAATKLYNFLSGQNEDTK